MPKRTLQGVVVSDKQAKTVVVRVDRRFTHPIYKKTIRRSKNYHAHDENNEFKPGDMVWIEESKPISKLKRWTVVRGEHSRFTTNAGELATAAPILMAALGVSAQTWFEKYTAQHGYPHHGRPTRDAAALAQFLRAHRVSPDHATCEAIMLRTLHGFPIRCCLHRTN